MSRAINLTKEGLAAIRAAEDREHQRWVEFKRQIEAFRIDIRTRYVCPEVQESESTAGMEWLIRDTLDEVVERACARAAA